MPTYILRCDSCEASYEVFSKKFLDSDKLSHPCTKCDGSYRVAIGLKPSIPTGKVFAGDWFKKQYGFEMGEKDTERAEEKSEEKKLIQQVKAEKALD